jgi:putative transposase
VRAGIVENPEDYRWCSYAAAVGGMRLARSGLAEVVTAARRLSRKVSWSKAQESYRQLLFGIGQQVHGGATPDGYQKSKGGFTQREIEAVCAAGGKLSLAAVLRCRVRYFTDGVVLGSQAFLEEFFESRRSSFGEARKSGARRMKGARWGGLRVLRDLRMEPVSPPSG